MDNNNPNHVYQVAPYQGYGKDARPIVAYYANEVYKPYPSNPHYLVSDHGNVFDTLTQTKLIPTSDGRYLRYYIDHKAVSAHRMVLETFDPNPNSQNLQVNHMNGAKWNNRFSTDQTINNLEWCTAKENVEHAYRTGLAPIGDQHPGTTWPDQLVHNICALIQAGHMPKEIAAMLNLPYNETFCNFVSKLRTGENRRNIAQQYTFPDRRPEYTEQQVHLICQKLIENQMSFEEIAAWVTAQTNQVVEPSFVFSIKNKSARKWMYIIDQYHFPHQHYQKETIEAICSLLQQGYRSAQVAETLGLTYNKEFIQLISRLRSCTLWPEIASKYNLAKLNRRWTPEDIHTVCSMIKSGRNNKEIADELGVPFDHAFEAFLSRLKSGKSYKDITSLYFPCS